MHPLLRYQRIFIPLCMILGTLSLACSLSQQTDNPSGSTLTRQPQVSPTSALTSTSTRTPTRTNTQTTSPTPTKTFTPTFTKTPTATRTASPTSTRSPTPTRTLSPGQLLLLQAETTMQSVHTMILKITLNTQSGVLPITLKGEGVAERPAKVYIKLSLLFQKAEIYSFSKDEVYVKPLGSDTWERTSAEQMDLPTSLLRNAFNLLEVKDIAINPILSGIEEVNGVACQQVTLGIDLPLFLAKHAPMASSQIDLVASRARGIIWIGLDNTRIHKLYLEMEIVNDGETIPVNATIEFSRFNEPVVFPEKPVID